MLVYQATKGEFVDDVTRDVIAERIQSAFEERLYAANPAEVRAWHNSMQYMHKVLNTPEVPDQCGVAIEYGVPYTTSRIDFLLTGRAGVEGAWRDSAVIVELKQWDSLEAVSEQDGIVRTFTGGGLRRVAHPSYQAWSYARMIQDYNEAVREGQIGLQPCAYLHNYRRAIQPECDPLDDAAYADYLSAAPVFCRGDALALREFICRHIQHADEGRVLYHIESGRLRPSKSLQDALSSMLGGNEEFAMIDDQKVVTESALAVARQAQATGERQVMIVSGGPGTGKSVVAVNLLVKLTAEDMVAQYVSKNAAPRNVYSRLLQGEKRSKAYIAGLFRGPGKFHEYSGAPFDALIVDEAHRLNERSGLYQNLGENQIKELISASQFSVFFIDENQRVTLKDIGAVSAIKQHARALGAQVHEEMLSSQFRCNGSAGYLEWLDRVLGIRTTDVRIVDLDYDFRVFDDPSAMHAAIAERNAVSGKARVVAGYCWEWDSRNRGNPEHHDIELPDQGYSRSWNLSSTDTWAIDAGSVDQVGCVHTCQGLEFDYVGVIIGDDMRLEGGAVITDFSKRAKSDASLRGIKSLAERDPDRAARVADDIIRNTYRVLMTRGMKGCYVYCTDKALAAHIRASLPAGGDSRPYRRSDQPPMLAAESEPEG